MRRGFLWASLPGSWVCEAAMVLDWLFSVASLDDIRLLALVSCACTIVLVVWWLLLIRGKHAHR